MPSRSVVRASGAAVLVLLLLFAALGPAKLQVRTELGWKFDHVIGYFGFTLLFCLAWPRPIIVGGALMAAAVLLEAMQALTPDRCCDFQAALYSVGGALAGGLFANLCSRRLPRLSGRMLAIPRYLRAGGSVGNYVRARLIAASRRRRTLGAA